MNKISPAFISANVHRAYLLQIKIDADPQETFLPQEKAPVPSHEKNRGLVFCYAKALIIRVPAVWICENSQFLLPVG